MSDTDRAFFYSQRLVHRLPIDAFVAESRQIATVHFRDDTTRSDIQAERKGKPQSRIQQACWRTPRLIFFLSSRAWRLGGLLFPRFQCVPAPSFTNCTVASYAIHMRPDTTRADKRRTHLKDAAAPDNRDAIYRLIVDHQMQPSRDFALGYACHILADRMWTEQIARPFRALMPDGSTIDDVAKLYYQDADQIDIDLYHNQPWRADVWRQLAQACPVDFAGLLTASEIDQWRDRTFNWFIDYPPKPRTEPFYITDAMVQDFIHQAATEITAQFEAWNVG